MKAAAEMRLAFSRRFGRHSRNASAPPELNKLAALRSSIGSHSQRSVEGSPSTSSRLDDGASHPPPEREGDALPSAEPTGRTGHTSAITSWSWTHRSTAKSTAPIPAPIVEEVLQTEIVLDDWEGVDPESFTRC